MAGGFLSARELGRAGFGHAESFDYSETFFRKIPGLKGKTIVHHAVEQQNLIRYPKAVTKAQIHSLENLRGIPIDLNSDIHLSKIRRRWNSFYRANPNPSTRQLLEMAEKVDNKFGHLFTPIIK